MKEIPSRYIGALVIILIVIALFAYISLKVDKSGQAERMLMDLVYWIPGMAKAIRLIGGLP